MNDAQALGALRLAVRAGDLPRVKSVIDTNPSCLHLKTTFGTGLHVAARFGQYEIVKYLLEQGANINEDGGIGGGSPLKHTAAEGHLEVARLLLDSGATMDVSESGKNPLFSAILGGNVELVKLLLERGIDKDKKYQSKNGEVWDAVAFAKLQGQLKIARILQGLPEQDIMESGRATEGATEAVAYPPVTDVGGLKNWLAQDRNNLLSALKAAVCEHVIALKLRCSEFYGYALLPEDDCEITYIHVAWNPGGKNKKENKSGDFLVNDWIGFETHGLQSITPVLKERNRKFNQLHAPRGEEDHVYDEHELAYREASHQVMLEALSELKREGLFSSAGSEPFLTIWFMDSNHPIVLESVRALNAPDVAKAFEQQFGSE